jgi:DeoR/GlpR family transcriptional regulator of sugar metabolism
MSRNAQRANANLQQICQTLALEGRVNVVDLAQTLSVSEVSIRKYLTTLEQQGVLIRTHGGAVANASSSPNVQANLNNSPTINTTAEASSLSQPAIVDNDPCKQAIAATAAKLIAPFSRIVVDSGSTTAHLLPYLQTIEGLVVMTNSLPIATALTQKSNNATVLMSGGTWDPLSQSFQGQMSEKMIASYNFEMAFVGASGLDLAKGTTTFHELTKLSQVMSDSSEHTIVLAQSDKLFKKMPNIELSWGKISTLVTDNRLHNDAQRHIQNYGVNVMCTPPMEK